MLRIRAAQIEALRAARWEDFFARALERVRHVYPRQTRELSDSRLRRLFNSSVDRSHRYGLRTEPQIGSMFESTILLGDRFETDPNHAWAPEVLRSRVLDPDDRAALLIATAGRLTKPIGDRHV